MTLLAASGDATKMTDSLHNYRIVQSYARAFFAKYLKAEKNSLLDQEIRLNPRVRVDRFGLAIRRSQPPTR